MTNLRRAMCVLVAAGAPLGLLLGATSAQAATPTPTITSVEVGGSELARDTFNQFYTNDPVNSHEETEDEFTVTVAGEPNAEITLATEGSPQTEPADAEGNATFTVSALSAGDDTLAVQQEAGGEWGEWAYYNVLVGNATFIGGPVDGSTVYNAAELSFSALGIPGQPIELVVDGEQAAREPADSEGFVMEMQPGQALATGYHTAYAQGVDAQGRDSVASETVHFYVAPPAPSVTDYDRGSPTPYINTGQPSITVSGVEAGATVNLHELDEEGEEGPSLDSVTSEEGGTVTLTPTAPLSSQGNHAFVVTQTVTEGSGPAEAEVSSDWTAPSAFIELNIETGAPQLSSDAFEASRSDATPSIEFSVEGVYPGESGKVQIFDAETNQLLGEASLDAGYWEPSTPLAPGTYHVYAVAIDADGNLSAHSSTEWFTVESEPAPTPGPTPTPAPSETRTQTPPPVSNPQPHQSPAPQPQPQPVAGPQVESVIVSSHTLSARHPVKVGFTASQPGTIKLTLVQKVHGRTKVIGTTTLRVKKPGRVSYTLSTRFAGHKLGRGSYTLTLHGPGASGHSGTVGVALKVGGGRP